MDRVTLFNLQRAEEIRQDKTQLPLPELAVAVDEVNEYKTSSPQFIFSTPLQFLLSHPQTTILLY